MNDAQRNERLVALTVGIITGGSFIALFCLYPAWSEQLKFSATIVGATFAIYQFHRHLTEVSHTHEWNRRKAAAEVNAGFLAPHIQSHWQRIYESVIREKKPYAKLNEAEQASVRELLTYLESVGLLLKHRVVDRPIIFELLGGAWPTLYICASEYIIQIRKNREDQKVFEHFVREATHFVKVNESLLAASEEAMSLDSEHLLQ